MAMREVMFEDGVRSMAKSLNISEALSGVVNSGIPKFGADDRHTGVVMADLKRNVTGFEYMTESQQKKIFNDRVAEVEMFNANVQKYVNEMKEVMTDSGLDYGWHFYIGDEENFSGMLERLRLKTSITGKNMPLFEDFMRQNTQFDDLYGQTSGFQNQSVYAKQSSGNITNSMLRKSSVPFISGGFLEQLAAETYSNANTNGVSASIGDTEQFKNLKLLYQEAMKDGRLDHDKEFPALMDARDRLMKETNKGLESEVVKLISDITNLIKVQKQLTNTIKNDGLPG
jgi:hypothetical protein